jgi:hypothetical protein
MQRNVPRCGALRCYEKESQEEKSAGAPGTPEDANQAEADHGNGGRYHDAARPDDHC